MNENADVTIIGAGIVGICSALSLLERGASVQIIDRAEPAEATSYGNAGVISPWSCVPQSLPGTWRTLPKALLDPLGPLRIDWRYFPTFLPWALRFLKAGRADQVEKIASAMDVLNRPNVELYRRHLAGTGKEHLLQDSYYLQIHRKPLAIDPHDLALRLRAERGAPMEIVDGKQLREIEPALSEDYQSALVIKDQARALSPGDLGKALAEKARVMGAEFKRLDVKRIRPREGGRWRIETTEENLDAPKLLIAAGPWSMQLLETLGIDLPLAFERGYHLECRSPGVELKHSVMDLEKKFVTSAMSSCVRSAGTAEFASLDTPPDMRRAEMLKPLTRAMLPELNTDDSTSWMGTRPSFPDSLPCVGPLSSHPNLHAAFGHSHYGLGMAPMTGEIIASLLTSRPLNVDLAPYRPDRFS
ncbi:MAG: NAD(P)/FAD-dependent oxidoreductase [Geminicoccaceae bacterium]